MKEYIERDAVLAFADRVRYVKNEDVEAGIQGVLIFVRDEIPAADVREVVRGEWEDAIQNCGDSPHVKCSVCGEYYWRYFKKFNFCPNCGAEMKGEADHV